jgi:hypothetical protein
MITVLTWLWNQPGGRTKFTADHVNTWADMVSRNLAMPHRLACVTDIPAGIDGSIDIIPPPGDFENIRNSRWAEKKPQCYRRLSMFRRDAAEIFGERFVCMDLDVVVGGQLDPLFDRDDDLVLFKGTSRHRPYNGSLMLIRAGCRPQVFETFTAEGAEESGQAFCGSDQAWLAHCLGWDEAKWDERDGVFFYARWHRNYERLQPKLLFFPGTLKPWDVVHFDRFVKRNYQATMKEAA